MARVFFDPIRLHSLFTQTLTSLASARTTATEVPREVPCVRGRVRDGRLATRDTNASDDIAA
jgi:hypothetical protein